MASSFPTLVVLSPATTSSCSTGAPRQPFEKGATFWRFPAGKPGAASTLTLALRTQRRRSEQAGQSSFGFRRNLVLNRPPPKPKENPGQGPTQVGCRAHVAPAFQL